MVARNTRRNPAAVVTFPGEDGASAAALLLMKYPKAKIFLSSKNAVAGVLSEVARSAWKQVHICGVGIPEADVDRVVAALKKMKSKGADVVWYCGYDYLEPFRPALQDYCDCRFICIGMPMPEVILRTIYPGDTNEDQPNRIRFVGTKYASREAVPAKFRQHWEEVENLKTLIGGAVRRWINFEEQDTFAHAVRVLAGIEPMTEADSRIVRIHGSLGNTYLRGHSKPIRDVRDMIRRCGPTDSPMLITGETGTGKEIVAKLIHESSPRAENLFASVNCANLRGTLLQDRLFGHKKGAFTGADSDKAGLFELATGGTLFLDEIGELPLETQAELLRVLQEGEFVRLGDERMMETDARIIAATNKALREEVDQGRFREDLYYRLAVLPIHLPPLRQRKEDIPVLARHILFNYCAARNLPNVELTRKQIEQLKSHRWPGNVREMENVLQRFVVFGKGNIDECIERRGAMQLAESEIVPLEEFTRSYVRGVLDQMNGNITQAAEALGISRNTLKARVR